MSDKLFTHDQLRWAIWEELKEADYTGENNGKVYEVLGIVQGAVERIKTFESTGVPAMRPADHDQVEINKAAGMPDNEASFQSGYTAGHDAGFKKGRRSVWVNCSERMPNDDMLEDFPKEYILQYKIDGGRGMTGCAMVNVEQMKAACKEYDFCQWLDESAAGAQPEKQLSWGPDEYPALSSAQCDAYAPVASINAGYATGLVFSIEAGLWPVNSRIGIMTGPVLYSRQEVVKDRTEIFVELDLLGRLVYRLTDLDARYPQVASVFGTVKGGYGGSYRGYIGLGDGEMVGVELFYINRTSFGIGITFTSKL